MFRGPHGRVEIAIGAAISSDQRQCGVALEVPGVLDPVGFRNRIDFGLQPSDIELELNRVEMTRQMHDMPRLDRVTNCQKLAQAYSKKCRVSKHSKLRESATRSIFNATLVRLNGCCSP